MILFTPLHNALNSLADALEVAAGYQSQSPDDKMWRTLRAGVIQNFELSYELSWKLLQRVLREMLPPEQVQGVSRRHLYRLAQEKGLIDDVAPWWRFHEARNLTSHVYDEAVADQVYLAAQDFLPMVRKLLQRKALQEEVTVCKTFCPWCGSCCSGWSGCMDWMAEVASIVRALLPEAKIWAFGSRVAGTARSGSDLDLLIDIGRPLTLDERAELSMRLEESALLFRVDFVDAHRADPAFLQSIAGQRRPL